jgi:hypothetical protein
MPTFALRAIGAMWEVIGIDSNLNGWGRTPDRPARARDRLTKIGGEISASHPQLRLSRKVARCFYDTTPDTSPPPANEAVIASGVLAGTPPADCAKALPISGPRKYR